MTETLNGRTTGQNRVGVKIMAALPSKEKAARHERMIRFLDSGDANGMNCKEISEVVGCSRSAVYNEFVKRRVPMTQGQVATYRLPASLHSKPAPKLKPGQAREKVEAYLRTVEPGAAPNASQIAQATGISRDGVYKVLAAMTGAPLPAPQPEPPVTRAAGLAEAVASIPAPQAGKEPEGKLVYLAQISDGRHVFLDLLTGIPWVMETVRPL